MKKILVEAIKKPRGHIANRSLARQARLEAEKLNIFADFINAEHPSIEINGTLYSYGKVWEGVELTQYEQAEVDFYNVLERDLYVRFDSGVDSFVLKKALFSVRSVDIFEELPQDYGYGISIFSYGESQGDRFYVGKKTLVGVFTTYLATKQVESLYVLYEDDASEELTKVVAVATADIPREEDNFAPDVYQLQVGEDHITLFLGDWVVFDAQRATVSGQGEKKIW